jgi:ribosomal protein S18 acetylase RimI-like enzyme
MSNLKYNIRQAVSSDAKELIKLCAEHASYEKTIYNSSGKLTKIKKHLATSSSPLYCVVAENLQGEILGYATATIDFSTWEADYFVHMDCLYLRPKARNSGIGKKLVAEICKLAAAKNIKQLQWQTPEHNIQAQKFYFRLGATGKIKVRMFLDENKIQALLS